MSQEITFSTVYIDDISINQDAVLFVRIVIAGDELLTTASKRGNGGTWRFTDFNVMDSCDDDSTIEIQIYQVGSNGRSSALCYLSDSASNLVDNFSTSHSLISYDNYSDIGTVRVDVTWWDGGSAPAVRDNVGQVRASRGRPRRR